MRAWWAASSPAVAPRTLSSLSFTFSLFPVLFTFTNSSSRSSRSDANAATSFPKCCILSSEEGEREVDATAREPSERALFRRTPNTGEVSNWGSRLLEYKKNIWEEHSYFLNHFLHLHIYLVAFMASAAGSAKDFILFLNSACASSSTRCSPIFPVKAAFHHKTSNFNWPPKVHFWLLTAQLTKVHFWLLGNASDFFPVSDSPMLGQLTAHIWLKNTSRNSNYPDINSRDEYICGIWHQICIHLV